MNNIIGFAGTYYTLWRYETEKTEYYETVKYYYIKNISKDIKKVNKLYPDIEIDMELKGHSYFEIKNEIKKNEDTFSTYKLSFGKYKNMSLEYVIKNDANYLVWLKKNTYDMNLLSLLSNNEELNEYIEKKKKERLKNFKNIETFDDNSEVKIDVLFYKNLIPENTTHYNKKGIYDNKCYWAEIDDDYNKLTDDDHYAYYFIKEYKPNLNIKLIFNKNIVKLYTYNNYCYALPIINNKATRIKNKSFIITGKVVNTDKDFLNGVKTQQIYVKEIIIN